MLRMLLFGVDEEDWGFIAADIDGYGQIIRFMRTPLSMKETP